MANKVILIGNVGADPEVRAFESGNNVARLRLATTERYKKDGEVRSVSEWHNVECWGRTANLVDDYVRKGDRLYIEGSIHYTEYTDRQGVTRYQTIIRAQNIELLTPKPKEEAQAEPQQPKEEAKAEPQEQPKEEAQPIPPATPMPPAPPIDPTQENQLFGDDLPF